MPFRTLNEGHYRALEKSLSGLVGSLRPGSPSALVCAGGAQADRIRRVLLDSGKSPLAGMELLPGILHLAVKLHGIPVSVCSVPPVDRAAAALRALDDLGAGEPFSGMRGNVSSASSLGAFFERLLEQGITPEMYSVSTGMLPEAPGEVELTTGRLFERYTELRTALHPFTSDRVMQSSPGEHCPYGDVIFYGFYDLNPGQRRFVRRLSAMGADVHWFSPVHPSSGWRDVYDRTGEFLRELGFGRRSRIDWNVDLSPVAAAADALLSGSASAPDSGLIRIIATAGDIGTAREVLERVTSMHRSGTRLDEIAVITRTPDDSLITRLAHHEGIPVARPLTCPLIDLPLARLAMTATALPEEDFHYTALEAMSITGRLDPDLDPGVTGIRKAVEESGVRSGLDGWAELQGDCSRLSRLAGVIHGFFSSRGRSESPAGALGSLKSFVSDLSGCPEDDPLSRRIFRTDGWAYDESVDWRTFSSLLRLHLSETVVELRPADPRGFRILSLEQARGTLWSGVVVTDLEEGVFPSRQNDDPRLPADLREALQLPNLQRKDREEEFLLYQAMESSAGPISLICRYLDSQSRPVRPSPFIAPYFSSEIRKTGRGLCSRRPASPLRILLGGGHRGQVSARACLEGTPPPGRYFMERAVLAERARFSGHGFDEYDGNLGPGFHTVETWSASRLEKYVRCPFAYMAESIWMLRQDEDPGVSLEPDPREHGIIVHSCFQRLSGSSGFRATGEEVMEVLRELARERHLRRLLGSSALEESYLRRLCDVIVESLGEFRARELSVVASEKTLDGVFGGLQMTGRMDMLLEKPDGSLMIADLKTGTRGRGHEALAGAVEKGSLYQPCIYRSLLRSDPGTPDDLPVSVAYVHVRPGTPFESVELDDEVLSSLEDISSENARDAARLIDTGFFPPVSPGSGSCSSCAYSDLCRCSPAERVERKLRGSPVAGLLGKVMGR